MADSIIQTAERAERAETDALLSRLSAIREKAGNPEGVFMERFGGAVAFVVKGIPTPYFNSVRGLTAADGERLDDILAFYREHGAACRIDLPPVGLSPELLERLAARGFCPYDFHASLYGETSRLAERADAMQEPPNSLEIRRLSEDEFGLFGDIYTRSFGMPSFLASATAENNRVLHGKPGWRFYAAFAGGRPAAVASMHVQDGAASLTAAATLPEYRRRGCHTALLAARLRDAAQAGCGLAVGQASFGSASQANMERMGLRLAYTKSLWRLRSG